jgi:hypothetical protein
MMIAGRPFCWQRIPTAMTAPAPVAVEESNQPGVRNEPLRCLLDVFSSLHCSRDARGKRYELAPTLALVVVATLAGCKNPSQICVFGRSRCGLLGKLGFRPRKRPRRKEDKGKLTGPNEDTIASILQRLSEAELNRVFALFLSRMVSRGAVAAIDGKALRGTDDYVLSVFVNDICQVVWQENVGTKENELSALERSLSMILEKYPQIKLFTGDAAFCQKSIVKKLIQAKRDYFLQLKSPHKTDVAIAEDAFAQLRRRPAAAKSAEKRAAKMARKL